MLQVKTEMNGCPWVLNQSNGAGGRGRGEDKVAWLLKSFLVLGERT